MVVLINTFHYLLKEGNELEDMKPLKVALDQYTVIHFQTEEALMKETGYPNLVELTLLHQNLTKRLHFHPVIDKFQAQNLRYYRVQNELVGIVAARQYIAA